jgi:hypothetical protein
MCTDRKRGVKIGATLQQERQIDIKGQVIYSIHNTIHTASSLSGLTPACPTSTSNRRFSRSTFLSSE